MFRNWTWKRLDNRSYYILDKCIYILCILLLKCFYFANPLMSNIITQYVYV